MDSERTIILVKAWPQPSQKYGETVCCAGVTPEGEWRRLFPVRFRHLEGDRQFKRWDILEYRAHRPRADRRIESRAVEENSVRVVGSIPARSRADFFSDLIRPSIASVAAEGGSLALIRPLDFEFRWKRKSEDEIAADRTRRELALIQGSLLDQDLAKMEPCPYDLRMRFVDGTGSHDMQCGDWETAATFFNWKQSYGEEGALSRLKEKYEGEYRNNGVSFAFGTMAKRPKTWLLLGIIRLDESRQAKLL